MSHHGPQVRAALTPLVSAMQRLPEGDRAAWLHDLRSDAPTVVAALESFLEEGRAPVASPRRRTGLRRLISLALL
jgi:hypothetical protein